MPIRRREVSLGMDGGDGKRCFRPPPVYSEQVIDDRCLCRFLGRRSEDLAGVCAAGVREAPRHEVAGGDCRWCGGRYGD